MKTKEQLYREDLRAWQLIACWWILCYLVLVAIIFRNGFSTSRVIFTLIGGVVYGVTFGIPMHLTKPQPPKND